MYVQLTQIEEIKHIIHFYSEADNFALRLSKKVSSGDCSIINGSALLHYNQFTIPCHFFAYKWNIPACFAGVV